MVVVRGEEFMIRTVFVVFLKNLLETRDVEVCKTLQLVQFLRKKTFSEWSAVEWSGVRDKKGGVRWG